MAKLKRHKTGDYVVAIICFIFGLICVVPMLNIIARSLSESQYLVRNEVFLWPKGWNFSAYATVLGDAKYRWSLLWTAILTVICTIISLIITTLTAYPLIYDKLKGRGVINLYMIITMFFNAGIIPNYLLLKNLHMLNQPIVLIIPSCMSIFNVIIMRSFFYGIPDSLRESAEIDGASYIKILTNIYIPLSKPVFATLALFYAVGRWNGFSDALMYVTEKKWFPIQLLLYNIINDAAQIDYTIQDTTTTPGLDDTLKAATVVFATVPILCIYPWLQNYFITGVTLGAVKE